MINSPSKEVTQSAESWNNGLDLGYLLRSDHWVVLTDLGLRQLMVVERTFVHIGVAVDAAEMTPAATVNTCSI